ncbi:hypothetical protein L3Y34_007145 [Caenorhabditis briggsae]|uniref:G-protein coupled receptors family 1 profile domain-containing protein n=1 Tax=Caenorhabditis briggsae TaxID=6238 RepID=A0AAE9A393_CAEBR|nr:hypothetical protein L3Y34_007145 [Caenorhabditis briggsae]
MSFNYTDADFGGFGFTESTINTWIAIADFISSISMTVVTYEFYLACGGVVANVFHLLILLQKSMRSNSVNVVMIGIAACDLFSMGFTVFSNLLVLVNSNPECTRSDHTTSLVILMTVTFMTGEGLLGICYVVQGLITSYPIFVQIVTDLSYIFGIFVALNSSTHCLICLTVSSQYRRTVKSLFLCESCKPRKASSKVIVSAKASVSSMAPVT